MGQFEKGPKALDLENFYEKMLGAFPKLKKLCYPKERD